MELAWHPRTSPLVARAVVATGAAARALGRAIVGREGLAAVAGNDLLVVLGESAELPWVDGATYLGRDPTAPDLLLPTALAPNVPAAVLAAALRTRVTDALIAVFPGHVVPCSAARLVEPARLEAWLG